MNWSQEQLDDKTDWGQIKDPRIIILIEEYQRDCKIIIRRACVLRKLKTISPKISTNFKSQFSTLVFTKTTNIINSIGKSKLL